MKKIVLVILSIWMLTHPAKATMIKPVVNLGLNQKVVYTIKFVPLVENVVKCITNIFNTPI